MKAFTELLESYDLLKKRKLKVSLVEAEVTPLLQQAEAKAEQYVQQAISAGMAVWNDPTVPVPKIDVVEKPSMEVWLAREGEKYQGQVVASHVSNYGFAVDVADFRGNHGPLDRGSGKWRLFVQAIAGGMEEAQPQGIPGGEPQSEQNPTIEADPTQDPGMEQDPMQDPMAMPMGMQVDIPTNPDVLAKLSNIRVGFVDLLSTGFFTQTQKMGDNRSWQAAGPKKDYAYLKQKILGNGLNVGSIESKLDNYTGMEMGEDGNLFEVPLSLDDQLAGLSVLEGTLFRMRKMSSNSFTVDDAQWVTNRVVRDHNGVWFKDPVDLPYGMLMSWGKNTSDTAKMFNSLVDDFNKNYEAWGADMDIENDYTIKTIETRKPSHTGDSYNLNNIRGKSAEEYAVAIHALYNGDTVTGFSVLEKLTAEYGANLQRAYESTNEVIADRSVGTEETAELLELTEALDSFTADNPYDTERHTVGVAHALIVKGLFALEMQSTLKRNPMNIAHVANQGLMGDKTDIREHYGTPQAAAVALQPFGFDPLEVASLAKTGSIDIGLKTYVRPRDPKLGESDLNTLVTSVSTGASIHKDFPTRNARVLGIDVGMDLPAVKQVARKMGKNMKALDALFSRVRISGLGGTLEGRRSVISAIKQHFYDSADFNDLIVAQDLEQLDPDNDQQMRKVSSLIKRKALSTSIKNKTAHNPNEVNALGEPTPAAKESKKWRQFHSMLIANAGMSGNEMLSDVRFLSTKESNLINHNKVLSELLTRYISGELQVGNDKFLAIKIYDPKTQNGRDDYMLRTSFKQVRKGHEISARVEVYLSLSAVRANAHKFQKSAPPTLEAPPEEPQRTDRSQEESPQSNPQ